MLLGCESVVGDNAIGDLRAGLDKEPLASIGYRQLAIAYQHEGKVADAQLASAEGSLIEGDIDLAKNFAKRAQGELKVGSPGWLKADDIVNYESPTASTD